MILLPRGADNKWAIPNFRVRLSPRNSDLKHSGPSQMGGNGSVAKRICGALVRSQTFVPSIIFLKFIYLWMSKNEGDDILKF